MSVYSEPYYPGLASSTGTRVDSAAKHNLACKVDSDQIRSWVAGDYTSQEEEMRRNKFKYAMQKDELVISRPYRSIFLTPKGQELAKACKERHRVVRDFLIAIGVDRDVAEQDAEGVEHHVSQATLQRFAEFVAAST